MKRRLTSLAAGLLFGAGLILSGMTDPTKVIGFLDITGSWDPSLVFVMGGAVLVHAIAYRLIRRRTTPLFESSFSVPSRKDIDVRLVLGAALFGVGWGLAGYCPGPAMTSASGGVPGAALFTMAMLAGMALQHRSSAFVDGFFGRRAGSRRLGTRSAKIGKSANGVN